MSRKVQTIEFIGYYLISIISAVVIVLPFSSIFVDVSSFQQASNLTIAVLTIFISILSSAILFYAYHYEIKRIIKEVRLHKLCLFEYTKVICGIVFLVAIVLGLSSLLPKAETTAHQQITVDIVRSYPIIGFIITCVIAPIAEEIAFRGILFKKSNIIISSVLFGLLHINGFSEPVYLILLRLLLLTGFGAYSCKLYEKYNNILPSILNHFGYNLILFFVAVWQ